MIPVLIPTPRHECFAMYAAAPGAVVLICPPIGDEARKTARLWRDLAVALHERGVASLRFDLPGTGNSTGEPTDPNLLEVWRSAIGACAEWAARRHGGRVIVLGYRFGALLALDAASYVTAERLVLLDPPVSGATVARYLRARARLDNAGPLPEGPDFIQAGEMLLSTSALATISSMPAAMDAARVPAHCLLVLPPNAPSVSPWPAKLATAGSHVETLPFDGYDDFAHLDAFKATPPARMLDRLADYLVTSAGSAGLLPVSVVPTAPILELGDCDETPTWFGPERGLFGVFCRPARPRRDLPAVLLPTTGVDPCSGMARMWTDLARRLARKGVMSLRFDMGGVGESQGSLGKNPLAAMYREERLDDLRRALDEVAAAGSDRVVVVGYCSGAYAAWHAAVSDARIDGVFAGNLLYLTKQPTRAEYALLLKPGGTRIGLQINQIGRYLPERATRVLRRNYDRARKVVPRSVSNLVKRLDSDREEARRVASALSARRCAVTIVMAKDDHGHIRLRRAFGEKPRLPKGIDLKVIDGADHIFSNRRHRARFLDLATAFVLERAASFALCPATPTPIPSLETAS